jgi:hypothetical protein
MEKRESGNQKIRMQDNRIADYQEALLFMIRSTALRAYPELAEGTGLLFTIDYFSVASFGYAQDGVWALCGSNNSVNRCKSVSKKR